MDLVMLAGIIAFIVALVAAAVGIYFAFRGLGYFQYLGGKKPGKIPPSGKNILVNKLLALNNDSKPYQIVKGTESDLLAEWKIADATWYGIFNKNKLSTAYTAFLLIDETRHSVRCYEEYRSLTWSAGTAGPEPLVHYRKSFFGGRILFKKTYGVGYGFRTTDPRSAGKVYEYRFDVDEIRNPVIATVEANGWEWVPVTGKRNATYPPGTGAGKDDAGSEDQFCMNCGAKLDDLTKQCPQCNKSPVIQEDKATVTPVIKPVRASPPPPPPPHMGIPVQGAVNPSPATSRSKGFPVKKIAIGIVIIFVVLFMSLIIFGILGGDSGNQIISPNLPEGTTAAPDALIKKPVTSPTDSVPPNTEVTVQVAKNPITNEISVIFAGGPGQKVLKELEIQVTRSDGQVLKANLIPLQQSEATISGSGGDDRVEVFAIYYSGQKYRIFDEIMKKRVIV